MNYIFILQYLLSSKSLTFIIHANLLSIHRCHRYYWQTWYVSPMSDVEIHGWQSYWSAIGFSRPTASLLNLKQRPTSLRDECLAGSGILQVNYSLEWVARQGVGWHAHHWGTPAPRRHLSPCASSAGVKLWGMRAHRWICLYVCMRRGNALPLFSPSLFLITNPCHRLDVLRNRQFSRHQ